MKATVYVVEKFEQIGLAASVLGSGDGIKYACCGEVAMANGDTMLTQVCPVACRKVRKVRFPVSSRMRWRVGRNCSYMGSMSRARISMGLQSSRLRKIRLRP